MLTEATDNYNLNKHSAVKNEFITNHLRESKQSYDFNNQEMNMSKRVQKLKEIEKISPILVLEVYNL